MRERLRHDTGHAVQLRAFVKSIARPAPHRAHTSARAWHMHTHATCSDELARTASMASSVLPFVACHGHGHRPTLCRCEGLNPLDQPLPDALARERPAVRRVANTLKAMVEPGGFSNLGGGQQRSVSARSQRSRVVAAIGGTQSRNCDGQDTAGRRSAASIRFMVQRQLRDCMQCTCTCMIKTVIK